TARGRRPTPRPRRSRRRRPRPRRRCRRRGRRARRKRRSRIRRRRSRRTGTCLPEGLGGSACRRGSDGPPAERGPAMVADASRLKRMAEVSVEALLLPLLIQLALIVAAARAFAWLFRRLGQPAVVGEIAAGLVLGPSVLGQLAPGLFAAVFRPALAGLPPEAS